jgi:hypothetical protein
MTKTFAADPSNGKARRLVRIWNFGNVALGFVACLLAILAFLGMLNDVADVWLTDGHPTFFEIVRVIMMGVGTFLFWQVIFRFFLDLLLSKRLREGAILKLDDGVVSLDLSTHENPAAVRFNLQQGRNAYLRQYADKTSRQQ